MSVEQMLRMLINGFEVFWSSLKLSLETCIIIFRVACKIHNYIISSNEHIFSDSLPVHKNNNVVEVSFIRFQTDLRIENIRNIYRRGQLARGEELTSYFLNPGLQCPAKGTATP